MKIVKTIIFEKINGNIGEEVGEIVGCDKNIVKIKSKAELNNGDGVKIIKKRKRIRRILRGHCQKV